MNDYARQRGRIISLTHTEIMFILTAVVLILLLAKEFDLAKATTEISDLQEKQVLIASDELGEQVTQILLREKVISEATLNKAKKGDELLLSAVTDAVEELVTQQQQAEDLEKLVDSALDISTQPSQPESAESALAEDDELAQQRADKLAKLQNDAAGGQAAAEALNIDNPAPEQIQQAISNLRDIAQEAGVLEATASLNEIDRYKLRFGFLPCWLGQGEQPQYFYTYRTTFDNTQPKPYRIQPHAHLNANAQVVKNAISSELRILLDYPKGWIDSNTLENFGKQVQARKKRMYADQPEKADCRLVTLINRKPTTGEEIVFIRDAVGFYPIYE